MKHASQCRCRVRGLSWCKRALHASDAENVYIKGGKHSSSPNDPSIGLGVGYGILGTLVQGKSEKKTLHTLSVLCATALASSARGSARQKSLRAHAAELV